MKALEPNRVTLRGTKLIEASAGTGKTYAITALYVRLLIESGLTVDQILVVTYTRAATAELRDRIRGRIRRTMAALEGGGDPDDAVLDELVRLREAAGTVARDRTRLLAALHAFDQAAIYTIHSFCQRTLQDNAFESGTSFDTSFITDQGALITEIAQDYWARRLYDASDRFVSFVCRPDSPRVTLQALVDLAREVTGNLDLEVLPAAAPGQDEVAVARWCEAHARAAAIWQTERDAIVDLLASSPALKKNMYKADSVKVWASRMDDAMRPGTMAISSKFDKFVKFTTAELAAGCKKGQSPPAHDFFTACDALPPAADDLAAREQALLLDFVGYAREQLHRRKQAQDIQSFDDLLYQLRDALLGPGGDGLAAAIRERYRAALIDEFQDTDPVQYTVFRRVYHDADAGEGVGLFLIGDPKQAIYAFRGADIFAYMEACANAAGELYTLQTNWRSDPSLIDAVNALFSRAPDSFVFDRISFAPTKPCGQAKDSLGGALAGKAPFAVLFLRRTEHDKQGRPKAITKTRARADLRTGVAREIADLLTPEQGATIDDRPVRPGDLAVLCRTNREASGMQVALREVGVPSVLEGDASVFDSPQAAGLERVLRAAVTPHDAGAVKAALTTPMLGVTGDELHALQSDEQGWDRWLDHFRAVHQIWSDKGFIQAFRSLLGENAVEDRLLRLVDGERQLTNLYHLGELLHAEAVSSRAGPETLLRWIGLMRTDAAARATAVGDAAQIRLESDAAAVKLVTIHKSKGLQYPIVYCPFLWDGKLLHGTRDQGRRFHDPDDANRLKLDLGSAAIDAHEHLAERETLAENVRLLYVALTRARHKCTVAWGGIKSSETSPLGYLLHQAGEVATDGQGLEALAERIKGLPDEDLLSVLADLQAAAPGAIEVRDLSIEAGADYVPPAAVEPHLTCREALRSLRGHWRTSSFSALTSADSRQIGRVEHERDHDANSTASGPVIAATTSSSSGEPVPLRDFPRGARTGQMLHDILETIDFSDHGSAALTHHVEAALARYGFEAGWSSALGEALLQVLRTPLPGADGPLTLTSVPSSQRLNELAFIFPVSGASGELTSRSLARALSTHPAAPWQASYPARVAELGFTPLAGFVSGFADLVFTQGQRWYLVDYKSNDLGPTTAAYAPARLAEAMAQHHYFLQYYIYLVALHRYLSFRLPGYDYEQHFGGVYYLFLRGMAPDNPPGCGVYRERPPKEVVEQLSALLGHAAPRGGDA